MRFKRAGSAILAAALTATSVGIYSYAAEDQAMKAELTYVKQRLDIPEKYTNTLVFQTKDGENVRFALEFENNSGEDFTGCDGTVFAGTKFYLVGDIKVPTGQTNDWLKRVFTKSYTTQGTVRISSLKQAYTYLPDLLDPRLEIGIKLVPNWMLSTPTNVPL